MRSAPAFLCLLLAATAASAHGSSTSSYALYTISSGDTLEGIARRYHLAPETIVSLNGLRNRHLVREGHGLVLPPVPSTASLPRYTPWQRADPIKQCPSTRWTPMHAAVQKGCESSAICSDGPRHEQVCVCGTEKGALIVRTRAGTTRLGISGGYPTPWIQRGDGTYEAEVVDADIDGDGVPETVVSVLGIVANGSGQPYRDLVVLKHGHELLRYDSGEFSAREAVVRHDGGCHLASAHLETVRHPLRGPALYNVERSFDPVSLKADPEIIGRRFGDAPTERFAIPFDPLVVGLTSGPLVGALVHAHPSNRAGPLVSVELSTPKGTKRFHFSENYEVRFVDARTQRAYPMGFMPPLGHRMSVRRAPDNGVVLLSTW